MISRVSGKIDSALLVQRAPPCRSAAPGDSRSSRASGLDRTEVRRLALARTERTLLFQTTRPFRAYLVTTVDTQRGGSSRERPSTIAEDDNPPGLHFPSALDGAGDTVNASLPSPPPSAPRVSTLSAVCSPRNLSRSVRTRKRSWDSTFRALIRTERRSPLEETILSCRCSRARSDSAETRVPASEAYSLRPAGSSLTRDERRPIPSWPSSL